jgi:hypothetical protein
MKRIQWNWVLVWVIVLGVGVAMLWVAQQRPVFVP